MARRSIDIREDRALGIFQILDMFQSKPSLVQTSNFGGSQGTPFNDAQAVSNWPSGLTINQSHPIQRIEIRSGWVVDSITTTYCLTDGGLKSIKHGSNPSAGHVVELGPNEIITNVYGKAGLHTHYGKEQLILISFVIFDTNTATIRVAGPFGGDGGTDQGQVFHVSGPIALAGFETNGDQLGISGISIIKSTLYE